VHNQRNIVERDENEKAKRWRETQRHRTQRQKGKKRNIDRSKDRDIEREKDSIGNDIICKFCKLV
jgi:hypothetical protein